MSWPLSEACLRVEARRILDRARAAPLVAAVAVAAWAGSVVVACRAGVTTAGALGPLLVEWRVAAVVLGALALTSAAAGATLGLTAPGVSVLGGAVQAAPVAPRRALLAVAGPRLLVVAALAAPPCIAAVVPLALSSPGGRSAGAALLAAVTASGCAGAAVAEVALSVTRTRRVRTRDAVGLAPLVLALLSVAGATRGLAGSAHGSVAAGAAAAAAVACGAAAWLRAAAERPPAPAGQRARPPRRRVLPLLDATALVVLWRAPDTRLALTSATCFGAVGLAVVAVLGDTGSGLLLAAGVAALTASLAPLAAGGRLVVARWVWSAADPGRVAGAWARASALAMALAVVPVLLAAALVGAPAAAEVQALQVALAAWAAALAAGSLVPRRASALGDDAASLAALVSVLTLVAAGGARAETTLAEAGIPSAVGVSLWLALACAAAGLALRRRVGSA